MAAIALVRRWPARLAVALVCAMSAPAGAGAVTGPAAQSFAPTQVGASAAATLAFTAGSAPAEAVQSVELLGAASASFQVVDDQCTQRIVVATCQVTIAFAPQSAGAGAATLRLVGDAGAHEVALTGTGWVVGPRLDVAPAALGFVSRAGSADQPRRTVTVSNSGDLAVGVDGAVVVGRDAGAFAIDDDGCIATSIGPGGRCAIVVRFTASGIRRGGIRDGPGQYSAQLRLNAATAAPIEVALTGAVTLPRYGGGPARPGWASGASWAEFALTRVAGDHRQITATLYTTLSARVRLVVLRRGAVVARLERRVAPEWSSLRLRQRLASGRYLVKAEGRRRHAVRRDWTWITIRR